MHQDIGDTESFADSVSHLMADSVSRIERQIGTHLDVEIGVSGVRRTAGSDLVN